MEITCPDEDAVIFYYVADDDFSTITFDNGVLYKEPITVSVDTRIYAVALKKGCHFSSPVSVEYDRIGNTEEDYYDIYDEVINLIDIELFNKHLKELTEGKEVTLPILLANVDFPLPGHPIRRILLYLLAIILTSKY